MPILDANSLDYFSRSPEQTRRMGMRLGALLDRGDIVCLSGDLGAGKTTLVQGIAKGWGSLDAVSSPTFILVNVYRRLDGSTLAHLDAYRMQSALEAEDLDLEPLDRKRSGDRGMAGAHRRGTTQREAVGFHALAGR